MKQYKKPGITVVPNFGGLTGDEILQLPDDELLAYVEKNKAIEEKKKYKIKEGFIMREIAGENTIVPVNPDSEIRNGIMMPNRSAVFMWEAFQCPSTKEEVLQQVLERYEVSKETARSAVDRFVGDLVYYRVMEVTE